MGLVRSRRESTDGNLASAIREQPYTVVLFPAMLISSTLHLGNSHAFDASFEKRILERLKLRWTNDGFNLFHRWLLSKFRATS